MLLADNAIGILLLALVVDRLFGDPDWLWSRVRHPVALFGLAIDWLDRRLNRPDLADASARRSGFMAIALLTVAAAATGFALQAMVQSVGFGWIPETLVVAIMLAQKSLLDHIRNVSRALRDIGVEAARAEVAMIVGRDTGRMQAADIARASVESAAENYSDGTIAPALWYLLCGLPGILVYKAINTADSMIAHKTEKYMHFGFASARLDDVLNFVPARLSAALIALAAPCRGGSIVSAFDTIRRDAPGHVSPNAGWPEAAMAGALDISIGGPRSYGSQILKAAWINPAGRRTLSPEDVDDAAILVEAAWAIFVAVLAVALVLTV